MRLQAAICPYRYLSYHQQLLSVILAHGVDGEDTVPFLDSMAIHRKINGDYELPMTDSSSSVFST